VSPQICLDSYIFSTEAFSHVFIVLWVAGQLSVSAGIKWIDVKHPLKLCFVCILLSVRQDWVQSLDWLQFLLKNPLPPVSSYQRLHHQTLVLLSYLALKERIQQWVCLKLLLKYRWSCWSKFSWSKDLVPTGALTSKPRLVMIFNSYSLSFAAVYAASSFLKTSFLFFSWSWCSPYTWLTQCHWFLDTSTDWVTFMLVINNYCFQISCTFLSCKTPVWRSNWKSLSKHP